MPRNQISIFDALGETPAKVDAPAKKTKAVRAAKKPGNVKATPHKLPSERVASKAAALVGQSPSRDICDAIVMIYEFASVHLFEPHCGKALPPCVIIPHRSRKSGVGGYFKPDAWATKDGETVSHEIAITPTLLTTMSLEDILMLVAHEACHLYLSTYPEQFGPNSKRSGHGKSFVRVMNAIGLTPSKTGLPGGKQSGTSMWHFVSQDSDVFNIAFKKLEATGFVMPWGAVVDVLVTKKSKSGRRSSYQCECCSAKASAKLNLELYCACEDEDGNKIKMTETKPSGLEDDDDNNE
jgi:predicted SprT family Zn-dependent metalloprotease